MHLTQRTHSTIRLAVLGALLAVGAVVAVPAVGAAVAAPAAPACGAGGPGASPNCVNQTIEETTTTIEDEETTTTVEETTTTIEDEETTTTEPEVAGETTVPTTTPVTVAGATVVRSPGSLTPTRGVVTELAATGPSDGPALPVGLVLVALGTALALVGVRPVRAERSTD